MSNTIIDLGGMMAVMCVPITAILAGHRTKMAKLRLESDNGASRMADERIAALEHRIRVLERIITDRGTSLAHEIEALRGSDALVQTSEIRSRAVG